MRIIVIIIITIHSTKDNDYKVDMATLGGGSQRLAAKREAHPRLPSPKTLTLWIGFVVAIVFTVTSRLPSTI